MRRTVISRLVRPCICPPPTRLGARADTEPMTEKFQPGPLGLGPVWQRDEHVVDFGRERRRPGIVSQAVQHSREPEHDLRRCPGTHPQPEPPQLEGSQQLPAGFFEPALFGPHGSDGQVGKAGLRRVPEAVVGDAQRRVRQRTALRRPALRDGHQSRDGYGGQLYGGIGDAAQHRPPERFRRPGLAGQVQAEPANGQRERMPGRRRVVFQLNRDGRRFPHDADAVESERGPEQRRRRPQRAHAVGKRPAVPARIDDRKQPLNRAWLAGQGPDPGGNVRGERVPGDDVIAKGLQPASDGLQAAGVEIRVPLCGHHLDGHADVTRGEGMADRFLRESLGAKPFAGAPVQQRNERRLAGREPGAKRPGEQVVVPEPSPALVQRDEEQVLPLEHVDDLRRVPPCRHRVAERRREPVEDRRLGEEPHDVVGLAADDLLKEIVGDVPVAAGELADGLAWVALASEGQRRQVQSGRPPLRRVDQFRQVTLAERAAGDGTDQARGLLGREAKLPRADLRQLSGGPQPGYLKRRDRPADDDDLGGGQQAGQQRIDLLVAAPRPDEVEVVQDEHHLFGQSGQRIDEAGHQPPGNVRKSALAAAPAGLPRQDAGRPAAARR